MRRYATVVRDMNDWKVRVCEGTWSGFMVRYDDAKGDWVTITFGTEEQAEQAAREYIEFWKEEE